MTTDLKNPIRISAMGRSHTDVRAVLEVEGLAGVIEVALRENWSAGAYKDNYRNLDNFQAEQLMGLDMDDGLTLVEAQFIITENNLCAALLPTRHHGIEKVTKSGVVKEPCDRYRVILVLAEPITDDATHRATWHAANALFKGFADPAAVDPSRYYYPSTSVSFSNPDGLPLPVSHAVATSTKAPRPVPVVGDDEKFRRASAWLQKRPGAIEGNGGDRFTFVTAAFLVNNFDLPDDQALSLLLDWNERCSPPWSEADLQAKVSSARKSSNGTPGAALADRQPVDAPATFPSLDGHRNPKTSKVAWNERTFLDITTPILNDAFCIWSDAGGATVTYHVNERLEATPVVNDESIRAYLSQVLLARYGKDDSPSGKAVTNAVDSWRRHTKHLNYEPALVAFGEGRGLVFKRFDFVPTEGPTPAWDEFLSRVEDAEVFMAWFWSCFESDHRGRQLLWLTGGGQDGKSVVASVLAELFGNKCAAWSGSVERRWGPGLVYGKPICIYADCKNTKFAMTENARHLTSGDTIPIEFKGGAYFTAPLRTRLFVHSNPEPDITGSRADLSRLLWLRVAPSQNTNDPTWSPKLRTELPAFLFRCRAAYQRLTVNHGDIQLPDSLKERIRQEGTTEVEVRWEYLFDQRLTNDPESQIPAGKVNDILRDAGYRDGHDAKDFREWMSRTYGVALKTVHGRRFYVGIRERSYNERAETRENEYRVAAAAPEHRKLVEMVERMT